MEFNVLLVTAVVKLEDLSECHISSPTSNPHTDFPILYHPITSMASTVTASVAHELTLGDEHEVANHICILVATQGDGTSFPHNSFQEEDLGGLCKCLGQACPESVLQLSETEVVLKFWSTSEMMALMHLSGATMMWHNKPIRHCIHPPTSTQVREYVAVRGRCPSSAQTQTLVEEVVSQSPPISPILKGAPPWFHMTLNDTQLRQVMEDLQQEAARREGAAPPVGSPLGQWSVPAGEVDANLEDGEMTLQGGGDGDLLRAATVTCRPPWTEEDFGHLLSTFTAGLSLGTLRINTFHGDANLGKTGVWFEQWYYEVQCGKDHYHESVVWESIIRSLKGAAAEMAWYIGPTTSVAHIVWKLLVIFSTVASFDVLMQNVYKVMQGNNEKVPSFATRLEGTLNQIRLQCLGRMTNLEVQQHLRDHLFHRVQKCISLSDIYRTLLEPLTDSWWSPLARQRVRMRRSRIK